MGAAEVISFEEVRARKPDFPVVLFRSDFVLVSEKNHMKVHKNQWLWDGPYSPDHLSGSISRGHTMAPEGQTPSQRPEMGPPHSDVDLQLLENKALSWVSSASPHVYSLTSRYGKVRV
jgi:hypothetical protein